jgi:hypothetical protein
VQIWRSPAFPSRTDFDLSVVPLYLRCSSIESNMETPSRTRDSRRNPAPCGHVAANWCADGHSRIGTQVSTLPGSWSPPTQSRLNRHRHQLLEFLSRSCGSLHLIIPPTMTTRASPESRLDFGSLPKRSNRSPNPNKLNPYERPNYSSPDALGIEHQNASCNRVL